MDGFESIGRAILSLALVIGVMWVLARWARGRGRRRIRSREGLEVIARQQLSRNSSIAVVRIADRAMVIGVTDSQVSLLGDVAAELFEDAPVLSMVTPASPAPAASAVAPVVSATPAAPFAMPLPVARVVDGPRANRRARRPGSSALAGSALSLRTWTQAVDVLRERTVRH